MEIAIIADDLTGANDSGVQLAKKGCCVSVIMGPVEQISEEPEVMVFDTNTRHMNRYDAYRVVRETSEMVKQAAVKTVYKKIDSTMRGNLGAEIDAVYDVFQPDFVVIAPAFPQNGRRVVNGYLYVNDILLHESEVASDPITPVKESFIPRLLQEQTDRHIALLTIDDLAADERILLDKLKKMKEAGIHYLLFDSSEDEHLRQVVAVILQISSNIVWVGSAGLASHIPYALATKRAETRRDEVGGDSPVLTLVGSMSRTSRVQLDELLRTPQVIGIAMISSRVAFDEENRLQEMDRVFMKAQEAMLGGKHVVVYCSSNLRDASTSVEQLQEHQGMSPAEIGLQISRALGEVAAKLMRTQELSGIILTGGDTAKQFCRYAGMKEFRLVDEVESGIPTGYLIGEKTIFAVTKAGSFGTDKALMKALHYLQGVRAS